MNSNTLSSFIFFLLFFSFNFKGFSFDEDFKIINDKTPLEFSLLFNSLKLEIKSPSEKLRMASLCKDLNDNLGWLQKESIFLLMKSETIKATLEYRFKKVRQFDMNLNLLTQLEENFKNKKGQLNPFAKWIWQSIIAELNHRKTMGLISQNSFTLSAFDGAKRSDAIRFEKYLHYLYPWIDQMDRLDAKSFNQLTKEVSWSVLERINNRSLFFKKFSQALRGEVQTLLINIPQKLLDLNPEEIKQMQNDVLPPTLSEMGKKEKENAAREIEKMTPLDMSPLSDEVNQELSRKVNQKLKN